MVFKQLKQRSKCMRRVLKQHYYILFKHSPHSGAGKLSKEGSRMKAVGIGIIVLAVMLGLVWILQENDFSQYKYFAPKYEQVRRETFEQSKAYNQGMVQELQNMQFQYEQAKPEQKDALASIILHRVADYDETKLPPDLRAFIQKLRDERAKPNWK